MGRYKDDRSGDGAPGPHDDDPIVRLARSWLVLKKSVQQTWADVSRQQVAWRPSWSWSSSLAAVTDAASRMHDEVRSGSGRAWIRARVYAQDTQCFQAIQRLQNGGGGESGLGPWGESVIHLANVCRANTSAGTGICLLVLGFLCLVFSGVGGGGLVDVAVAVEGCPDQTATGDWRHSCQPQWTGEIFGWESLRTS